MRDAKISTHQIEERLHVIRPCAGCSELCPPSKKLPREFHGPPPDQTPRPPSLHCCLQRYTTQAPCPAQRSASVHCFQTPVNRSIVWVLKPLMPQSFPRERIHVVPTLHGHHTRHLLRQTPVAAEGTMDVHPGNPALEPKQSHLSAFSDVHAQERQGQGTSPAELPNNLFGLSDAIPQVQPFFSQAAS